MPKTAKQNAAHQQAYRDREKAKIDTLLDNLMEDVDIYEETKSDGKRYITLDMGEDTRKAIDAILALQGSTFEEWFKKGVGATLKDAAKLQAIKAKYGKS